MSTPSTDPRAHAVPATPREVIASYTEYADAQAAVDTLSDKEFPVASTQIGRASCRERVCMSV